MNYSNNTTNEPAEPTTASPLILQANALYLYNNLMYIAVNNTEVQLLGGGPRIRGDQVPGLRLFTQPGSELWVKRVLEFRDKSLDESNSNRRLLEDRWNQVRQLENKYRDLGEALKEKAEENSWCAEYDEFAEEWDLPKRLREYEVTVTVRIMAGSDDDAEEVVGDNFSLSVYDDNVVDGPHVSAIEV